MSLNALIRDLDPHEGPWLTRCIRRATREYLSGYTVLQYAVIKGDLRLLTTLCVAGADVNVLSSRRETALYLAEERIWGAFGNGTDPDFGRLCILHAVLITLCKHGAVSRGPTAITCSWHAELRERIEGIPFARHFVRFMPWTIVAQIDTFACIQVLVSASTRVGKKSPLRHLPCELLRLLASLLT